MNIFVIHSGADKAVVAEKLAAMRKNAFSLNPLMLGDGGPFWKADASKKIRKAQMVVFFIGENSHKSENIAWELKQAQRCKKPVYSVLLSDNYSRHEALRTHDSFSGQATHYDKIVTLDEIVNIINSYDHGEYPLFNQPVEMVDRSLLLEQYKIFLQTSEDLISRRQNVNNFYISINSAIVALFSSVFVFDLSDKIRLLLGMIFAAVGIILSIGWIKTLIAYGNLNGSKMKIISSIEKQLPASLYDAEWAALSDKLNKKRYVSFTDNEKRIPAIFILLYTFILAILALSLL